MECVLCVWVFIIMQVTHDLQNYCTIIYIYTTVVNYVQLRGHIRWFKSHTWQFFFVCPAPALLSWANEASLPSHLNAGNSHMYVKGTAKYLW